MLGVHMYEPWIHDFEAFEAHIESLGPKPTPQHTPDRINPLGDYAPGNVRWADKTLQSENRRNNMRDNLDKNSIVEVGNKYDMLIALEPLVINKHGQNWYAAKVRCECGNRRRSYTRSNSFLRERNRADVSRTETLSWRTLRSKSRSRSTARR